MGKQEYKIGCLLATATSHRPVWVPPWHELSQDISPFAAGIVSTSRIMAVVSGLSVTRSTNALLQCSGWDSSSPTQAHGTGVLL